MGKMSRYSHGGRAKRCAQVNSTVVAALCTLWYQCHPERSWSWSISLPPPIQMKTHDLNLAPSSYISPFGNRAGYKSCRIDITGSTLLTLQSTVSPYCRSLFSVPSYVEYHRLRSPREEWAQRRNFLQWYAKSTLHLLPTHRQQWQGHYLVCIWPDWPWRRCFRSRLHAWIWTWSVSGRDPHGSKGMYVNQKIS